MEILLSVAETLALFALCTVLGVTVYTLLDFRRYKESKLGKENERLEELIANREAKIAALEEELDEVSARLDEYRTFGIMHPTEDDNG